MREEKRTVFVGLSGGVDSSASAYLLKEQGYNVVGVFIKVWHPDFLVCDWEQERLDAMRVAAHLGIPFLTCDAEDTYKQNVANRFVSEYAAGRTPNPDVLCNAHVKFGHFYEFARKEGADYIATGHYAKAERGVEHTHLIKGRDPGKDQSYFLWDVPEEVLARTIFPVGDLLKNETRAVAERAGLPTAAKKDSQGICFLGHVDIREFLSHYISMHEGPVLDLEGNQIGTHYGVAMYTVGQRHGFLTDKQSVSSKPYFVERKDMANNTVYVSRKRPVRTNGEIDLTDTNWIGGPPVTEADVDCVMRYHGNAVPGRVTDIKENGAKIAFDVDFEVPAAGQSCVLYQGGRCLGGGIMDL